MINKLLILPSSYLFIARSHKLDAVGKGHSWGCSQRLGMGAAPGSEKSSIKSFFHWVFWGAEQPILYETLRKAVALNSMPALGWRGCRKPLQELLLVNQRPPSCWMLVWIRILAALWLWGCVLLCRQISARTPSCLFCISPDAHIHQELGLDPSSKPASSFPFC